MYYLDTNICVYFLNNKFPQIKEKRSAIMKATKFMCTFNDLESGRNITFSNSFVGINDNLIYLEHDISNIAVTKDKLFILYSIAEGCSFDDVLRDNIDAYDNYGNLLYNIGDIISGKNPYGNICIHSDNTIKNEPLTDSLSAIGGHEYLVCYTLGDQRFIVDTTDMKLVLETCARWNG
jgi:hypothetical protein